MAGRIRNVIRLYFSPLTKLGSRIKGLFGRGSTPAGQPQAATSEKQPSPASGIAFDRRFHPARQAIDDYVRAAAERGQIRQGKAQAVIDAARQFTKTRDSGVLGGFDLNAEETAFAAELALRPEFKFHPIEIQSANMKGITTVMRLSRLRAAQKDKCLKAAFWVRGRQRAMPEATAQDMLRIKDEAYREFTSEERRLAEDLLNLVPLQ